MDRLKKSNCEYREHQDYSKPAECKKFTELAGITTTFQPSICAYCLNSKSPLTITSEPFLSQYHRLSNNGAIEPPATFDFANCILLDDPIGMRSDYVEISEYLELKHKCHYYGECNILPRGHINCQLCTNRLRINYEFNNNPDFSIYGKKPKFGNIEKWAVGITTSARKHPTIVKTIKALEHAGWDTGMIFAEPGSYIDCGSNWDYVYRSKQTGIFGNWILGLYELFIRNINADAFFMTQDDIVMSPNSRKYLEDALWFTDQPHLVSLFGPNAIDQDPSVGWRETSIYNGGPNAIIMSHETVQEILSSLTPLRYYGVQHQKKVSFDDLGIFKLMSEKNWSVFYPKPSIGDHIGHQSTHCRQLTKWVYSDRVLCNHQYYDVEHWYITDNREAKADLTELRKSIEKFGQVNWLVVTDGIDPSEYLKNHCKSEWIITTELRPNTRLLSDIRDEIIKYFIYDMRWLKFGFGILNGRYIYTENGPCRTLCERSDNPQTCLSEQSSDHICKIIKGEVFWSTNAL